MLVAADCAAPPDALPESEPFGHGRGAFTGVGRAAPGMSEGAAGGTLFPDEIAELPLALQTRTRRVLQERQIRGVGSTTFIDVDASCVPGTGPRPE